MDSEYARLLNLSSLPSLFECEKGYMDIEDCSWYHRNWMLLRYLGMVSNPLWHEKFYLDAIKKYAKSNDKVLVIGTADFSMPLICERAGLSDIVVSDICKTPLNICKNVSEKNGFHWKTKQQNIFDGIPEDYSLIFNDAFLSRFPYDKKRSVFQCIHDGLSDNGVYVTTFRHGWNAGKPVTPNEEEKSDFINRVVHAAKKKKVDVDQAAQSATQYIEKMVSYPVRDESMLRNLISGLFTIEQISVETVPGECAPTEYFRFVAKKIN